MSAGYLKVSFFNRVFLVQKPSFCDISSFVKICYTIERLNPLIISVAQLHLDVFLRLRVGWFTPHTSSLLHTSWTSSREYPSRATWSAPLSLPNLGGLINLPHTTCFCFLCLLTFLSFKGWPFYCPCFFGGVFYHLLDIAHVFFEEEALFAACIWGDSIHDITFVGVHNRKLFKSQLKFSPNMSGP